MHIKQLVVFAVLMREIENRAPRYVMEKWATVNALGERPETCLDPEGRQIFDAWIKTWGEHLPVEVKG